MSNTKAPRQDRRRPRRGIGYIIIGAIALLTALTVSARQYVAGADPSPGALRATTDCARQPPFIAELAAALPDPLALATDRPTRGLVLVSLDGSGRFYQHPSWDDAGYLGAMAFDSAGNIYVAPTPRQSLADNPLSGATTLWRVDGVSGMMQPFATLPGAAHERNPFGILGLSFACDLDLLFAGTVIGSTPETERGGVVTLTREGAIHSVPLRDRDVMGVTVARTGANFLLLAGMARQPLIVAIPLNRQGHALGEAQPVIDLTEGGAQPGERARKLRIVDDRLIVDLVPFNYSLQHNASGQTRLRRAVWRYDAAKGRWSALQRAAYAGPDR